MPGIGKGFLGILIPDVAPDVLEGVGTGGISYVVGLIQPAVFVECADVLPGEECNVCVGNGLLMTKFPIL